MKYITLRFYVQYAIDYITTKEVIMVSLFKVQRLSRKGVHHKLMVMEAVSNLMIDDIVQPAWKHAEVHKRTGNVLRTLLNISVVFGMSADKFMIYAKTSYGISYTPEQARALRDKYFKLYPQIAKYHKNVWRHYKDRGYVVKTALGKVIKPRMGTDAINIPVQGTGAECTKLSVHYLVKDYPQYPMLKYIYNCVHDAVYLRVPKGMEEELGDALNKSMVKAWVEISKTSLFNFKDIPIMADVETHK